MFLELRVDELRPEESKRIVTEYLSEVRLPEGGSAHVITSLATSREYGKVSVSDEVDDLDFVIRLLKQVSEGIPVRQFAK